MNCTHLSQDQRYPIRGLRRGGWSLQAIAVELQRASSTISRALQRNATSEGAYEYRCAQRLSVRR
ncbi:MAG: helix-turn-helix domain-containing protein, partial [Rhodanobacteraceae bacterium]